MNPLTRMGRLARARHASGAPPAEEIDVTPDGGGVYTLQINAADPDAGSFAFLTANTAPAPVGGVVSYTAYASAGVLDLTVIVEEGTTTATEPGPLVHSGGSATVEAETSAVNTVEISGTVSYVRDSDSAQYIFNLLPHTL